MGNKLKIHKIFLILSVFFLSGCATIYNPATGKKEIIFINTKGEIALGSDIDAQMQRELKILNDPLMQARLEGIGERIAQASDRKDVKYNFRIVNDGDFNAFALPGGFIYVNSGLMNAATDHELACVLGHEAGHIAAKHSVKKLQTVLGYQILMSIAVGAGSSASITNAVNVVFNFVNLGFSRKDEYLADTLGITYAKRAGFSPYAMVSFFNKLKKQAEEKGRGQKLVFFSSHPPIEDRIKRVEEEITK